ncbi:NADH dehydrogenase [ubiquinone] 1 alpha subcomplex assembly factor 3 isoform X3 [Passer domesticus]|uniref:NADH dehydrogenase [ubiquinone] 1 alpha subcomplex assembly factor 3 isoform X3 n=1 Tax=Passer domesticus TaxID=48849 RepID=UPI0030FEF2CD
MAALRRLVPAAARAAGRAPFRGHRLTPADDEMYQRTRVMVLEPESPNIMFIEGYSTRGFTISGDLVVGPCAVLPRSILQWNVSARPGCGRAAPRSSPQRRRVPAGWLPPGHLAREPVAVPAAGAPDRDPGAGHGGQSGAAPPCHDEADAGVRDCCGGAGHGECVCNLQLPNE